MTRDHQFLRRCYACPNCLAPKDLGLIVCWPCHRLQLHHNGGGYSDQLERRLGELESFLTKEVAYQQDAQRVRR